MANKPNGRHRYPINRDNIGVSRNYALSGKSMLSAIVILFTVVIFILLVRIYVRFYHLRRRRNYLYRPVRSRFIFASSDHRQTAAGRGLDAAVLRSLPVFFFSSKTHPEGAPLECTVCLCEFEESEKGRLLPKCNHCFHTDCIDMWFHSHSTCPLCRDPVERYISVPTRTVTEDRGQVTPEDSNLGQSSELCEQEEETGSSSSSSSSSSSNSGSSSSSSSSSSFRRNALGLVGMGIDVPRRNESFKGLEGESGGVSSPGLRSTGSGILALKRILSGETRAVEIDLERGDEQNQR